MSWNLNKEKPICSQLCEIILIKIASGEYKSGEKAPSVRDLAVEAGVTPNTVQRSLEMLESQGVFYTVRGLGRYVSDDTTIATKKIEQLREKKVKDFFSDMQTLGLSEKETKEYIANLRSEKL